MLLVLMQHFPKVLLPHCWKCVEWNAPASSVTQEQELVTAKVWWWCVGHTVLDPREDNKMQLCSQLWERHEAKKEMVLERRGPGETN